MTRTNRYGYAFAIALPPETDAVLRRWTESTPGASYDAAGGHVTVARCKGDLEPEALLEPFESACRQVRPFEVTLCRTARGPYWDKPGLEIVMLVGGRPEDVQGVLTLRERVLAAVGPLGVRLAEGEAFVPHLTLTTGLAAREALELEAAAEGLALRFTASEVMYWSGGEEGAPPAWRQVRRVRLE